MRRTAFAGLALLGAVGSGTEAWAGEVRGRLVVDSRPAAGVTVSAIPYETPFEEARRQARRQPEAKAMATTASGADGAFLLTLAADPGGRGFRLKLEGPGVVPIVTTGVYDASESEDIGDETLARASSLAGRVVDEKGQPLPGAEVTLVSRAGGGFGPFAPDAAETLSVPRVTLTGADGSFRFQEARAQNNRLTIEARGYASVEMTVRDGAVPRPIPMQLGTAVSGVVRAGRAPAAGALVRFEGKADSRWVETGADGSFRLSELAPGNGTLIVDGGDQGMAEVHSLSLPEAAAQKLQVTLAPGSAIEGRVIEAKTGKPVSRVKVLARSSIRLGVARSGADGRYRIAGLLPQRYRVEAEDQRYVPYERTGIVVLAGATEKVDLPLTPGSAISGRVVDEDGNPVGGARGRLVAEGDVGIRAFVRQQRPGARAAFRTNADGTFRATRLAPGDNQSLTVTHADFESRTVGGLNLPPGGTRSGISVVLSRGLSLVGLVKDGDGKPVPGADVRLNQTQLFRGGRGGAMAQLNFVGGPQGRERVLTGSDGRFEFKGLTSGDYMLVANKQGFSDGVLDPVKVTEGGEPVELVINAGASISGSVIDSVGVPAEGFIVQARPRGGAGGGPMRMAFGPGNRNVTGPDGSFSLEGLQVGEAYDLIALGAEGPEAQQASVKAPADSIQLVVPGRGKIAGRILDAANGQPVSDFEIGFNPDRSGRGAGGMVIRIGGAGGRRGNGQRDQVHAEDGAFVLDDVPPGTWEINVDAKSYQAGRVGGLVVEPGQTKEGVVIKLSRGSAIRGRVLDGTTSRPVPDVRVTAEVAGGQGRPPMLDLLNGGGGIPTDADGAFEVDGLSQGRYLVTATHPDYAEASQMVDVKEGVAAAEIRIQAGGVLGGVVMSETRRALPGVAVMLEPSGDGGGFGGRRGPFADSKGTVSDTSGHFRFDHLTAGRYRLVASLRNRSSSPLDAVLQASEVKDDVQLALQAGATVRGTVTGLQQNSRGNVNITATGPESYFASVRAGTDATFVLEGVPAGTINLRATAGDFLTGNMRSAAGHVTVPDGQTDVPAEIEFESGFTLTGTVTRGGQPVGSAMVMANPRGGSGSSAATRSDASGNYQLEGLQQGSYMVNAMAAQGGSHAQEVQIEGDQTLDIQIPVARLAGTVVEAGSKQPLSDVRVQAQPAAGSATTTVRFGAGGSSTDSNGRFAIEDLDASAYTLSSSRAGFQIDKRQVTASDQGSDDLVVELQRGDGIGIAARDGILGIPLRGLTARVADASGTLVTTSSVTLDSEGRGEIQSIKPGQYLVTASASGYAPISFPVTVPSPQVAIVLTPGGNLEIHAGAATLAQGYATLLDGAGRPYQASGDPQMVGPGMMINVTMGGGRINFSAGAPTRLLQHLPPGRYSLVVTGQQQPPPFMVAEGQTITVTLP